MTNEVGDVSATPHRKSQRHMLLRLGELTRLDLYFVASHDRRAEARTIRERFGDVATLVPWAERYLPKFDER